MDTFVLRDQYLFLVADLNGEITPGLDGAGLYTKDTRFLSMNALTVNGEKPKLLSKHPQEHHLSRFRWLHEVHDKGAVEIMREPLVYEGCYYERFTFTNYFSTPFQGEAAVEFDADFQDMFIVRGFRSGDTGEKTGITLLENGMVCTYKGKDELVRKTKIMWNGADDAAVDNGTVSFKLNLPVKGTQQVTFKVMPLYGDEDREPLPFSEAEKALAVKYEAWHASLPAVETDDRQFSDMYEQAVNDMQMLLLDIGHGETTVAGIPWYAVPFGRDSIITALFMLAVKPDLTKGTLKTLAAYQGKEVNPEKDEEPGKIMHELRSGELATTGQSPFTPYYGTVDATALFLLLASEYYRWTKDDAFIQELKPNLDAALEWVRKREASGDNPFVTYKKEADKGIPNQGWKDSSNSMVHKDGSYADSPIALVEVQGYVAAAKQGLSSVYKELGFSEESSRLNQEAADMRTNIDKHFWVEEEAYYALALDGHNEQIKSVTSNPGHLLFSDVAKTEAIVSRLISDDLNNGYGVRTMSAAETGYYPMSYHNGSVWPHDNGMILLGLQKHGADEAGRVIMEQISDASIHFDKQRLPELYCGYDRGSDDMLVPYLTTCSPQAWSAATALLYVQLMAGINPDAVSRTVTIRPNLPDSMNELAVRRLPLGDGYLSLVIKRSVAGSRTFTYDVEENTSGFTLS